jgi:hypothetical protein
MGLESSLWRSLAWHVRNGFADFERANWPEYDRALGLERAPAEWFEDPEALGHVTVRVIRDGRIELATPAALFFLRFCDPLPQRLLTPPGIGLACVYLIRTQGECPLDPVQLARLALDSPQAFFYGVLEEELPDLCCTILSSEEKLEEWHLHALVLAIDRARINARAPHRIFHSLLKFESVSFEVRREFCRGILRCSPYFQRLQRWSARVNQSARSGADQSERIPQMWIELANQTLDTHIPGLRRHAVVGLVEALGEPPGEVIEEFLLRRKQRDHYEEMVHQGALDVVKGYAASLGAEAVDAYLQRAIRGGSAAVRQYAYRIGFEQFGPSFAIPALDDCAKNVRGWAEKALAESTSKKKRPSKR